MTLLAQNSDEYEARMRSDAIGHHFANRDALRRLLETEPLTARERRDILDTIRHHERVLTRLGMGDWL